MNRILLVLIITALTFGCNSDDPDVRSINNILPNIGINLRINLDLPEYQDLNFPSNAFVTKRQGVKGIIIYNVNNSQYNAFELSDPNHPFNDCSALILDGIKATCGCKDGNEYDIFTGAKNDPTQGFPLKAYRVRRDGNILTITN